MLGTACPVTHHILEGLNLQKHHCENFTSCSYILQWYHFTADSCRTLTCYFSHAFSSTVFYCEGSEYWPLISMQTSLILFYVDDGLARFYVCSILNFRRERSDTMIFFFFWGHLVKYWCLFRPCAIWCCVVKVVCSAVKECGAFILKVEAVHFFEISQTTDPAT
jgi:hypothetical protein